LKIEPREFRQVLGRFATGVAIITTRHQDKLYGMTVNSFTSVSLDPPLVLFCAIPGRLTVEAIRSSGHYAVNILQGDQLELCRRFAGMTELLEEDRFAGLDCEEAPESRSPWLADCLGWLDCQVREVWNAGDHEILLAEVTSMRHAPVATPLVFYSGILTAGHLAI
jgi:3-hydroxy-9,10-secoandrosta-1,3,5(10)-triene-9,17-dione monooxygenase reductase component